jgi:O-acetyl-ADP-ribose deacetylase (regulator of RNase III)
MKFGWQLQDRLQVLIKKEFNGEIPVGMAALIETNDKDYPWLVSAPTMRVPMVVKGSVNAYLAFRAVLLEVKKHPDHHIESILCPGLGTAVGEMTPWCCAKQMYEAYRTIWLGQPIDPKALDDAYYHHQQMAAWERFLK